MTQTRKHWDRPDFEVLPLGAEVTAYLGTDSSL
ncbi:MAG: pyrroloquinoline quinone precursor peptide PqqA [Candidatus Eremiobacteraeota bacterium]|nr:pyrroloquinoline quinone precursor peptide PqqA [Candidatus Eremiobacteraeota bacterium]MBV9648038.1 pyrroloquinoline quinone precursor peptide PqqA [Candidatus Eremiobacteraeota bacterium]